MMKLDLGCADKKKELLINDLESKIELIIHQIKITGKSEALEKLKQYSHEYKELTGRYYIAKEYRNDNI